MIKRDPWADRALDAHRPQQKRRKVRMVAGLRIGVALATRFGPADRGHMRWIGLWARAITRL
jgi:hypothetical protein